LHINTYFVYCCGMPFLTACCCLIQPPWTIDTKWCWTTGCHWTNLFYFNFTYLLFYLNFIVITLLCVSKNVPPLDCYNFGTWEWILIFFGRNVTDRVSNQKTYYYVTSNNLFLHYLVKQRTTKIAFSLKCCINALPAFNHLFDLFNLFDSHLILTMLYDSLNHVINAFSPEGCWGHGSGGRKSRALQQLDCVARTMHQYAVFWFPISQGNAEALERWGGKTKHCLISNFLRNTFAKNYPNRIVCVLTIANQRWDVFWDTV